MTSARPTGKPTDNAGDMAGGRAGDAAERTRLTRHAVVDQALALADSIGLEALTIRKLATQLGVTPMALYWHFRSKEELLDSLVEWLWSEIDIDIDPAARWPDQFRRLLESLLAVLRAHPAAARLLLEFEKHAESSRRPTEVALEILRGGAGFDPEHAAGITRFGLWTAIMLVMSEPGEDQMSPHQRAEVQRTNHLALATLPSDVYPRLVECAVAMTMCDDPEFHYRLGVSIFIAGVEAMAARQAASQANT